MDHNLDESVSKKKECINDDRELIHSDQKNNKNSSFNSDMNNDDNIDEPLRKKRRIDKIALGSNPATNNIHCHAISNEKVNSAKVQLDNTIINTKPILHESHDHDQNQRQKEKPDTEQTHQTLANQNNCSSNLHSNKNSITANITNSCIYENEKDVSTALTNSKHQDTDEAKTKPESMDTVDNKCNGNYNNQNTRDSIRDLLYFCDSKGRIKFVPNLRLAGRFRLIKQLGDGISSRVFEVLDESNGSKKAIKCIKNVIEYKKIAKNEISILNKIANKDENNDHCCVHLLEYCEYKEHPLLVFPLLGRSIYDFLKYNSHQPFKQQDLKDIARQIFTAVSFVHSLDIIITDIKTENIVFVNDDPKEVKNSYRNKPGLPKFYRPGDTRIKLIDFGNAKDTKGNVHGYSHKIQTRHFRSPEVICKMKWYASADIWSIGCTLIELLSGNMLFATHENIDHLNQIVKCVGPPPSCFLNKMDNDVWNEYFDEKGKLRLYRATISPFQSEPLLSYFKKDADSLDTNMKQLFDLVKQTFHWMPDQRCTAASALKHPYFTVKE